MRLRLAAVAGVVSIIALIGPVRAEALDPNLLGWWKFEEGSGSVAHDSSGHGIDAALLGNPTWARSGSHRGVVVLDGIDDHIRIDGSSLRLPLYSIALWFRVDGGTATRDILSLKGPSGVNGILLELSATGVLRYLHRFPFGTTGGNNIYSTATYADGAWHHVAAVKTAESMMLYVDGEQIGTQADSSQFDIPPGDLWLGTLDQRMQRLLLGALDDVRIYKRVLSDQEVGTVVAGQPDPFAYAPSPGNGAVHAQTWALLEWGPGDLAVSHHVYLGESHETVANATPEDTQVFRGSTNETSFRVGLAGYPYPEGLRRGTTYYWRIDEINDQHAGSPWKGEVWSFTVPPETAWKPVPAPGAKFVDANDDLSWQPGLGAVIYNVFFGADFNAVDTAPAPVTMLAQPTFDPGPMVLGATYYWRIDEFDGKTWHRGSVWSFTVTTAGGGLKGEYYANVELSGAPVLTRVDPGIDFDFGDGSPEPGVVEADGFSVRWVGELEVAFTETYSFYVDADNGVRLWIDDRLLIDQWTAFRRNEHRSKPIALAAGGKYSIVLEYNEQDGPAAARLFWQSDSQAKAVIPSAAFSLPVRAIVPRPGNGAVDVRHSAVLTWRAGDRASQHDVYIGTDRDAVAGATPASAAIYQGRQPLEETMFDPGTLAWSTTYYWRIDEVNDAHPQSPWTGSVWSFTTAGFLVVDDFEGYSGEVGARIFQTWIDGMGYTEPAPGAPGNGTGSLVGTADYPWVEMTVIHGGNQSMPLGYNNTFLPYYSETERTWETLQDWTVNGVDTLSLYFRGDAANTQDSLYLVLEDSAGRKGTVVHADPAALLASTWQKWSSPLSEFTSQGVNLARVKKMSIGVGNRGSAAPGGAGQIYIDDIRVTGP